MNTTVKPLQIVAGENFWGNLVSQLGGSHVQVLSVVSDPNADPHEYESNTSNARAFANADYVILNGAGYDSWGDKLLSAGSKPSRKVLNVADLLGKKEGDNPHFWYNPSYVNQVVGQTEQDLIALDPTNAAYYKEHYQNLQASLAEYRIASLPSSNNSVAPKLPQRKIYLLILPTRQGSTLSLRRSLPRLLRKATIPRPTV